MDKCLQRHKLPKLVPEEIYNLSSYTSTGEAEFVVKNFAHKKTLGPDDFTSKLCQTIKK